MSVALDEVSTSAFLTGGGEMGSLMRAHDWSTSPLGEPETWPQPLRTVASLMLAAGQPMFVAWGPLRILLYNDAYALLLADRHPAGLGRSFFNVWPDIENEIAPLFERVFAGEPVHMEDIELRPKRPGRPREAHFAFSYTPVRDVTDAVAGLFCVCAETTDQVLADRRRAADAERQRRLFEQAPGFITILSGEELRFEFVNEAYKRLFGRRDFIGRTVRQVFPDLEGQPFFDLLENAYATGERFVARAIPISLQMTPEAEPSEHFLDFIYEPVRDEAGEVTGLFIEGHDVTEAHFAREALSESEARHRFRVELGDALRGLTTPSEIMAAVAERLGPRLGVDQANYYAIDGDRFVVTEEWRMPTSHGLTGDHLLADFGEATIARIRAGEALRLDNTRIVEGAEAFAAAGMAAVLSVPLHQDGRWAAGLHVHQSQPRVWTDDEEALLREVASHAWAAVERVRAETTLRESEARQAFLLSLSDTLRSLDSPLEIASTAAERLGERFGLNRVFYAEYFGSVMRVERDFTRGVDSIVGEHELAAFGPELLRAYHECPIVKVDDVATDERFNDQARAGLRARQVGAYLDVILFENAQWVSLMAFQSAKPRKWTAAEETLFREVGERVKSAIERARAEEQLRELNETLEERIEERSAALTQRTAERDRLWQNSQDVLVVIDAQGTFRTVNPSFTRILGWTEAEAVGRTVFDFIHPDDQAPTLGALEQATEQELPTFENRYRHKDGGWRWLSWVAAPQGELIFANARHVTAEKEASAELALAQEALRQSQSTLR